MRRMTRNYCFFKLIFDAELERRIIRAPTVATLVDSALPFVQYTYKLQGDGHLAFECYDTISSVSAAVHVAHYNVEAISQRLAPNNVPLKQ